MSKCIPINNGILCIARIFFVCPHCGKQYNDACDKYLNKVNANKCGYTKIKCTCGEKFGMTYDFKGDTVGFKLITKEI